VGQLLLTYSSNDKYVNDDKDSQQILSALLTGDTRNSICPESGRHRC